MAVNSLLSVLTAKMSQCFLWFSKILQAERFAKELPVSSTTTSYLVINLVLWGGL